MASEINKDEAKRCIIIAKEARKALDYEKAVKFLQKSINLFPTDHAKNMLVEVRALQPKPIPLLDDKEARRFDASRNKEEADRYIRFADGYIEAKDYENAEKFLLESDNMFPSKEAKKRLKKLRDEKLKQENMKFCQRRPMDKYDSDKMPPEVNKDEAEKCIQLAKTAFNAKDFKKAEELLLKSDKLFPSDDAKENLGIVRDARKKK